MGYWIFSTVIPIAIIAGLLTIKRPSTIRQVSKALNATVLPLATYILLVYFLEIDRYINSGWALYTLIFFSIPYLVLVIILYVIAIWKNGI
ncbi:hypothetical protein DYBT9275_00915 [Dyadobacter sp. CECT 9275]|uniref:Uncharacterized protein n=1 Tax=Dyadobacter helix TaxID=2822344 RepID=A0A916J9A7_9BACT|nr:hypothetical protein DYBT9275_00915 [Dyadobacter sp. CECT 9275]